MFFQTFASCNRIGILNYMVSFSRRNVKYIRKEVDPKDVKNRLLTVSLANSEGEHKLIIERHKRERMSRL